MQAKSKRMFPRRGWSAEIGAPKGTTDTRTPQRPAVIEVGSLGSLGGKFGSLMVCGGQSMNKGSKWREERAGWMLQWVSRAPSSPGGGRVDC